MFTEQEEQFMYQAAHYAVRLARASADHSPATIANAIVDEIAYFQKSNAPAATTVLQVTPEPAAADERVRRPYEA